MPPFIANRQEEDPPPKERVPDTPNPPLHSQPPNASVGTGDPTPPDSENAHSIPEVSENGKSAEEPRPENSNPIDNNNPNSENGWKGMLADARSKGMLASSLAPLIGKEDRQIDPFSATPKQPNPVESNRKYQNTLPLGNVWKNGKGADALRKPIAPKPKTPLSSGPKHVYRSFQEPLDIIFETHHLDTSSLEKRTEIMEQIGIALAEKDPSLSGDDALWLNRDHQEDKRFILRVPSPEKKTQYESLLPVTTSSYGDIAAFSPPEGLSKKDIGTFLVNPELIGPRFFSPPEELQNQFAQIGEVIEYELAGPIKKMGATSKIVGDNTKLRVKIAGSQKAAMATLPSAPGQPKPLTTKQLGIICDPKYHKVVCYYCHLPHHRTQCQAAPLCFKCKVSRHDPNTCKGTNAQAPAAAPFVIPSKKNTIKAPTPRSQAKPQDSPSKSRGGFSVLQDFET